MMGVAQAEVFEEVADMVESVLEGYKVLPPGNKAGMRRTRERVE